MWWSTVHRTSPAWERKTVHRAQNTPLTQRCAALPERCAVRRASGTQKRAKRRENFRSFSWQWYASDLGHAANLSDNARVTSGDVQCTQQTMPCCKGLVLLGVIGILSIVLQGLMCGKLMPQSRHTYLTSYKRIGGQRSHSGRKRRSSSTYTVGENP